MMSDRDVRVKAGDLLAWHGALTPDYIIKQFGDVLCDRVAVEDWRRIAAAVDVISEARPQ